MSGTDVELLVVGAGVAGLAAAGELARTGRDVLLVDTADGPGGVARTDLVDGFRVERGPNTFRVKFPLRRFLEEAELSDALVRASPASRRRCVFRDGRLVPVPMDPIAFARTPLLSRRAKWRLLAEPFVRRGDAGDESVAEFTSRRLGQEVATHLVGAFLTGVYAGDERRLGAAAVFPSLVSAEREHGSIVRGALADVLRRRGGRREKAWPGIWSGRDGVGGWTQRLAEVLPTAPRLETEVIGLSPDGDAWRADLCGPDGECSLRARGVVVATPARQASALLGGFCRAAAEVLDQIVYSPIASIAVVADPAEVRTEIEGFGFIVPRDAGLGLLGCLYMSRLYPNRTPSERDGRALLHCMLGGMRWPESVEIPDDALEKRVLEDLDRTLGLRGEPRILSIRRTPRAVPQPGRRHVEQIAAARRTLNDLGGGAGRGMFLAGAYLDGVAVPEAFASGLRAAREILA